MTDVYSYYTNTIQTKAAEGLTLFDLEETVKGHI